jgi:hypothetical protein
MFDEYCPCEECAKIQKLIETDPRHPWVNVGPAPAELRGVVHAQHETKFQRLWREFRAMLRGEWIP